VLPQAQRQIVLSAARQDAHLRLFATPRRSPLRFKSRLYGSVGDERHARTECGLRLRLEAIGNIRMIEDAL